MIVGRLEKPITLTLQNGQISLTLRPVVLRGLTTPLNVSYKTMEERGIDVLASRGVIMFQGRKVWLGTKPPRKLHKPVSVHIEGVHVIPPMTQRYVPARVKNTKTFEAMKKHGCYCVAPMNLWSKRTSIPGTKWYMPPTNGVSSK